MINKYFATVARGLENIAAQELKNLGAINVNPDFTGVHFEGDKSLLYRVNLWGRTIFRVLKPIREIKSDNAQQLYNNVHNIDWEEYLTNKQTFAVRCTGSNPNLNHTHFTALQIKNAIIDRQRKNTGIRSSIEVKDPDVLINAHIQKNRCILSLDSSGESLHRRGFREAMGLAPLKETLAAALLDMTEWNPDLAFFDPMCGSGTLPLEATLKALNIAPGLYRQRFGFQTWLDFDASIWENLVIEAKKSQISDLKAPIWGSDYAAEIIEQAYTNSVRGGLNKQVKFSQKELSAIEAPAEKGVIICNPPYGKRMNEVEELSPLYKKLGDIFKQRFRGWTAYILTGNKELAKKVGLKASRRISVYNGSLPCTLLQYELY
jgi:putative N6-adenine-specific DNA methylase